MREKEQFLLFLDCCKHAGWGDAAVVYALHGRMIKPLALLFPLFLKINCKKEPRRDIWCIERREMKCRNRLWLCRVCQLYWVYNNYFKRCNTYFLYLVILCFTRKKYLVQKRELAASHPFYIQKVCFGKKNISVKSNCFWHWAKQEDCLFYRECNLYQKPHNGLIWR